MERRAASHTEEEEMNHRRRLLNAAKRGDQKAIGKLLELYQVRIYSGDMVTKMNKTSATHKLQAQLAEGKPVKGGSGGHGKKTAPVKPASPKLKHAKPAPVKRAPAKPAARPAVSKGKPKPKPKSKPKSRPVKSAAKKRKK
jgi:outer membrane biosynthesis protein TonB